MATGQDRNFQIDELFPAINGTRANITRPIVGGGSRVRAAGLIKGNRSGLSDKTRWKGLFFFPFKTRAKGWRIVICTKWGMDENSRRILGLNLRREEEMYGFLERAIDCFVIIDEEKLSEGD